ncbi:MAG: hypothetical protein V7676_10955 [Parasphingorhabdus sp.]|uniref:hypothetical protein n=1 Tax=Parasphingorhabdus sp. TaxID=2709688 RepID=UPI003003A477
MKSSNLVKQELSLLANLAARLLATPVATITVYDKNSDDAADNGDNIAHMAVSCDKLWATNHPDIDIKQLGSPRNAMTQQLELYVSIPMRNGDGGTVGMVACAGDETRDLNDQELGILKHITALAAAVVHS